MFFNKNVSEATDAFHCEIAHEIERLQKLENGVRHYSGGIYMLHERITTILLNNKISNDEIFSLLKDVSVYLRDLKIAGKLERDYFPHAGDGC